MSEENKIADPLLHGLIEKKALREQKKGEVLEKELKVKERRLDNELDKMAQGDKDTEIAKNANYGALSEEEVANKQLDNTVYMQAARNKMSFINERFNKAVPFFRKNLILIGGKTGEGKSTTVANVIRETLKLTDKNTGKRRRILVLTNEEKSEDVYNRVTCLIKGWHYTNHDQFTDEQIETFNKYIAALSKDGMLTVIDDAYGGALGTTTTVEGICQVFDNLLVKQDYYDVVLIDYYQNIKESRKNPHITEWEAQAMLVRKLDQYKNIYPAPIVLLAQVTPPDEENRIPFKVRIEGRKSILNVATCALEMVANRELLCTEWHIHKSRFNEAVGEKITTGYDKGRYVLYTDEFKENVTKMRERQERESFDRKVKMPTPEEEKKEVKNE